jgi:hypothetical protein
MTEAFDIEFIRYKGLPLGTKIIAEKLHLKSLNGKPGFIVLKEKIYKEFINESFVDNGTELEEWYIKKILKKQKWSSYNETEDLFMIEDKKYKFIGYNYGCEYEATEVSKGKPIMKVAWDNIKKVCND